jgi:predicted Fe-Mo cluster-binding NifX family protein
MIELDVAAAVGGREDLMKVAVATNNYATVSQHYGTARYFLIVTVEDGEIVARDVRRRPGSLTAAKLGRGGWESGGGRGHRSAAVVADCDALIAGGMGRGAYENLKRVGVEPVLTDARRVDEAVLRYCRGDLPNLEDRLHDGADGDRDREPKEPIP